MTDDVDAAMSTSDPASSAHETWLSTFFGMQPQAADPVTPAGEAPCSTFADDGEAASSAADEAEAVDPDTAAAPTPAAPDPDFDPETGEPRDAPPPTTPDGADPDFDPATGGPPS